MEAKQFLTTFDFDMTPIKKRIEYWNIKMQKYDFNKATDLSRLHLIASIFNNTVIFTLKASKENCDYLKKIILNHIKNNIIE